jgi:exonuclease III
MEQIQIASWSIRGLFDPHRRYLIRNWLSSLEKPIDILLLQETKTHTFKTETTLRFLLPNYNSVISYPHNSKGGTLIAIHPSITIINSGTTLASRIAWAELNSKQGKLIIAKIYAPNISVDRKTLWKSLQDTLPKGNWIIAGDFNMMEEIKDSTINSPLIQGN